MNKYIRIEQALDRVYLLYIDSSEKLNNKVFTDRAPKDIIDKVKQQKKDSLLKLQSLTDEYYRLIADMLDRVNNISKNK